MVSRRQCMHRDTHLCSCCFPRLDRTLLALILALRPFRHPSPSLLPPATPSLRQQSVPAHTGLACNMSWNQVWHCFDGLELDLRGLWPNFCQQFPPFCRTSLDKADLQPDELTYHFSALLNQSPASIMPFHPLRKSDWVLLIPRIANLYPPLGKSAITVRRTSKVSIYS